MSKSKEMTREQYNISQRNRYYAVKYFESTGELPKHREKYEYAIHHKDESLRHNDVERYIQWNIEDLEVVKFDDHTKEHHTGKYVSEETKQKLSDWQKGTSKPYLRGKKRSEETKKKISESLTGKKRPPRSEEFKEKMRNRDTSYMQTEEYKRKVSESLKGQLYFTNGEINIRKYAHEEIPEGFYRGRTKKKGVYHHDRTSIK